MPAAALTSAVRWRRRVRRWRRWACVACRATSWPDRSLSLLTFAGFRLGEAAAPVLAAADKRGGGEREQPGAYRQERQRNRTLEEDRPVAVRHDQRLAQRHLKCGRDHQPEHQWGRIEP